MFFNDFRLFFATLIWGTLIFAPGFDLFAEANDDESESVVADDYLEPCDLLLDRAGDFLFVLEANANQLRRIRLDGSEPPVVLPLAERPVRMKWFPDESAIAVVGGRENGWLQIVRVDSQNSSQPTAIPEDPNSSQSTANGFALTRTFSVGHCPSDVAVGTDASGKTTIYVSLQFRGKVVAIDSESGETTENWDVGREPFSMEITPNGRFLVVADLLPEHQADVSFTTCAVYVVDLQTRESRRVELLNGIVGLKQVAISPDGKYAFVTGAIGNYLTVTSQVVGGWITENLFAAIDIEAGQLVDTFYLDDTSLGAGNPWGITCSDDGRFLAISIAGTDEILFMPYDRVEKMLSSRPKWNRPGYGAYTFSYQGEGEVQLPLRLRVKLGIKGMRRVIMRGDDVYVNACFDDAIGKITVRLNPPYSHYPNFVVKAAKIPQPIRDEDRDAFEGKLPKELDSSEPSFRWIPLEPFPLLKGADFERSVAYLNGSKPRWSPIRRGEALFCDATICMEHWQSCITCHPDGRVDGLNWDLMNDGVGNPKNTKSLLLSHETPPSMISGVREDAEAAVRAGVIHILFSSIPEEDYCAMDEYLKAMKPIRSPYLTDDGELSDSAKRGRFLFESSRTNCSTCHPEPLFTDLSFHNVGSSEYYDNISKFDTPTLIEVWRTAPYLNTGHYKTIRELLIDGKHGNADGLLEKLSEQELDDLIEYVLSL